MDAGICASNGGNRPGWSFLVIRHAAKCARLGELYREAFGKLLKMPYYRDAAAAGPDSSGGMVLASARHLAEHLPGMPVLILAGIPIEDTKPTLPTGASIYPAAQNILLAARALAIGNCLTAIHRFGDPQVKELLGIPPEVEASALIWLGYPLGKFGPPGARQKLPELRTVVSRMADRLRHSRPGAARETLEAAGVQHAEHAVGRPLPGLQGPAACPPAQNSHDAGFIPLEVARGKAAQKFLLRPGAEGPDPVVPGQASGHPEQWREEMDVLLAIQMRGRYAGLAGALGRPFPLHLRQRDAAPVEPHQEPRGRMGEHPPPSPRAKGRGRSGSAAARGSGSNARPRPARAPPGPRPPPPKSPGHSPGASPR